MSKTILGVSAGFHDAAISVIEDGEILFAGHSERYSKKKHDKDICEDLLYAAAMHCDSTFTGCPDIVAYYEKPWLKKLRQLYSGQYDDAFDLTTMSVRGYLKKQVPDINITDSIFRHYGHHQSHAAAAFQTSPYDRATVVVIDAIGEWDTISILGAEYDKYGIARYKKLWGQRYPNSIGLFYTAMTKRVGLRPLDEEYILMGMAGYGDTRYLTRMREDLIYDITNAKFTTNLHIGVGEDYLQSSNNNEKNNFNIAAAAQITVEDLISEVMIRAKKFNWSTNLVYTGGVALNCSANRLLGSYFDRIWIMPNPGDAGSSLGAAAAAYGKKLNWTGPYLGTLIRGEYPVQGLLQELLTTKIVGVASGKAEFGPRALGNRSLLADPRGSDIKDTVNKIKHRQQFRPFAPVILEEFTDQYFAMPKGFTESPYMQVTARCLDSVSFPAIVHVDGTSRVQTVAKDCNSGIRALLEAWYAETGCPMLLNTSLNIRGEPMVDTRADADRFEQLYGVTVLS